MAPNDLPGPLELLARFDDVVDGEAAASVLSKIASLLGKTEEEEEDIAIREQLVETIERVPKAHQLAAADVLAALRQALASKIPAYPDEAATLLRGELTVARHLAEDELGQVAADVQQFLENGEAEIVRVFTESEIARAKEALESSIWLKPLGRRLANAGDEETAHTILITLLNAGKLLDSRDKALEELLAVLRNPSQPGWSHALRATGRVIEEAAFFTRPKTDLPHVEAILESVLQAVNSQPDAAASDALDTALVILQGWRVSRESFLASLEVCIQADADRPREAVRETVRKALETSILTAPEQESIVEAVVTYLNRAAPQTPHQLATLYDTLHLLREAVPSKADEIYRVIRSYSRPDGSRPTFVQPEMRPIAYQHMGKMGYMRAKDARHELEEMLQEARGTDDDSLKRTIVEALAALREAKVVPRSGRWSEIGQYVGTLGESYQELAERFA